jgi:hypothetical protein
VVIADIYQAGRHLRRTPHVDVYHDLDALMRARVQDLTAGMSLVFVRGGLEAMSGEGPVVGLLAIPRTSRSRSMTLSGGIRWTIPVRSHFPTSTLTFRFPLRPAKKATTDEGWGHEWVL